MRTAGSSPRMVLVVDGTFTLLRMVVAPLAVAIAAALLSWLLGAVNACALACLALFVAQGAVVGWGRYRLRLTRGRLRARPRLRR
jgi:hypothetical protein